MNLVVLTPEKEIFNGDIKSVKVPGTDGQFEVLAGHAAIVSSLKNGPVRILDAKNTKKEFTIERGFLEVFNNEVSLLVQGVTE